MPLTEQTMAEMRAGMAQVASVGGGGIDPAYMDAMIRTGIRAKWLRDLERAGKIKIDKVLRSNTNGNKSLGDTVQFVVHIGDETFEDPNALLTGAWPSEVLVAQIALALGAGVGENT